MKLQDSHAAGTTRECPPGNIMAAHLPFGRSFEEFVSLRISSVLCVFFFSFPKS